MLRFKADRFYVLTLGLKAIRTLLEAGKLTSDPPEDVRKNLTAQLEELQEILGDLGLRHSNKSVERLHDCFSSTGKFNHKKCQDLVGEIEGRVKDELEDSFVLCLPSKYQDYYEPKEPLFGSVVDSNFPSSNYDISEAGKCFALGRYTASVAHLMRALETPLNVLSTEVGLTLKRDNWGEALTLIETEISKIVGNQDKKSFLSAAATQFRFFKDAWRNHVMHAKEKYTEEEADIIFRSVRAFIMQLAKRLKENEPQKSETA